MEEAAQGWGTSVKAPMSSEGGEGYEYQARGVCMHHVPVCVCVCGREGETERQSRQTGRQQPSRSRKRERERERRGGEGRGCLEMEDLAVFATAVKSGSLTRQPKCIQRSRARRETHQGQIVRGFC